MTALIGPIVPPVLTITVLWLLGAVTGPPAGSRSPALIRDGSRLSSTAWPRWTPTDASPPEAWIHTLGWSAGLSLGHW